MSDQLIAANRFGFGRRPGDAVASDPRGGLRAQLQRFEAQPAQFSSLAPRAEIAGVLAEYLEETRALRQGQAVTPAAGEEPVDPVKTARRFAARTGRDHYAKAVGARFNAAVASPTPFVERLVHFWANHFAISADKLTVVGLSGMLEIDAIRSTVLGKFSDMLLAVERHPAMLLYLDQAQSVGPNSPLGQRVAARGVRQVGLNENLAREILELHTLGVRTGYAQADVTEFARALTGWTVSGLTRGPVQRLAGIEGKAGEFAFVPLIHEPGPRTVIGTSYRDAGEGQAKAILADLAVHPATARHIATKLARHFAADEPPPGLIAKLERRFRETGGDLPSLYGVLIDAPEIWATPVPKFKTPWDWLVSSFRAVGLGAVDDLAVVNTLRQLGQPVWQPKSPAGYDDIAASWAGPDALFRRVEVAERIAMRAPAGIDPRKLSEIVLPGGVGAATAAAIARAESPVQGLSLLLVSPEFLRR